MEKRQQLVNWDISCARSLVRETVATIACYKFYAEHHFLHPLPQWLWQVVCESLQRCPLWPFPF